MFGGAPPPVSASSGKISTSYLLERLPASRVGGNTGSKENSKRSSCWRIQPDGIDPPYLSTRPTRSFLNINASPVGLADTASKFKPTSVESFCSLASVVGLAGMKCVPAGHVFEFAVKEFLSQ